MKAIGIVRKIDELGRVVLPMDLRRTLQIEDRDSLDIFVEGNTIVLKKHEESCIFCGSVKNVTVFKGKNICPDCINSISNVL